ncbi:MAG: lyase, partial [Nitrosopumilus sp.]|nr:lyase [Nitrosopumilus sp.]
MKKSKPIYFVIGMAFLIVLAVTLTALDESAEPQKESKAETEITGTPADKYDIDERDQHCGNSNAKTNQYIKEFKIPTPCTQPLSII